MESTGCTGLRRKRNPRISARHFSFTGGVCFCTDTTLNMWNPVPGVVPISVSLGKLIKAHLVTDEYDIFDLVVEMNIKNM